jgi:hypothetical protein
LALPARTEALGGASAAGAEGADALLTNPAGIAALGQHSPADLSLSYNSLLETAYLGYGAFAKPIGKSGALAAGVVYFSQGAMTAYTNKGDPAGSFAPQDMSAAAAYAHRFERFSLGGSVKFIRSVVDDVSGNTAAVDIGAQSKNVCMVGDRPLDLGAAITNIGPAIKMGGYSAPLPMRLAIGAVWHTSPVFDSSLDVNVPTDNDPYVGLGVEGHFSFTRERSKAFIRLGYNQKNGRDVDGLAGLTAGAGLDLLSSFRLDYAWVPLGDLGMQNRVTLAFRF